MKILVVTQYFYPETFRINSLCIELVKRGYEVDVLTGYPQYPQGEIYPGYGYNIPYRKEWNGVKIHRVKVAPRGKSIIGMLNNCISFVVKAKQWVKKCETRYDAVFVFEVSPVTVGLPAVYYKKKFNVPMIFNLQDLWPENVEHVLGVHNKIILKAIDKIVDKIYKNSDKILCSSQSFVNNLKERGVEESKLEFWPQFCDEPDFSNAEKPVCYSEDYFNIVFAGNIGEAQGLDLLTEAALGMKEYKVKWFIVGDGRARKKLQDKVEKEKLLDNVIFVGKVSEEEANRYVHFADYAYLSFSDNPIFDMTIPAKLQTYLACGTPILAAASGESAQLIYDNNCGEVVERNPEKIVEKVIKLAEDKKRNEIQRQQCVKVYKKLFSKDKIVDGLCEILREKSETEKSTWLT